MSYQDALITAEYARLSAMLLALTVETKQAWSKK